MGKSGVYKESDATDIGRTGINPYRAREVTNLLEGTPVIIHYSTDEHDPYLQAIRAARETNGVVTLPRSHRTATVVTGSFSVIPSDSHSGHEGRGGVGIIIQATLGPQENLGDLRSFASGRPVGFKRRESPVIPYLKKPKRKKPIR